jgi:hypothetical protein
VQTNVNFYICLDSSSGGSVTRAGTLNYVLCSKTHKVPLSLSPSRRHNGNKGHSNLLPCLLCVLSSIFALNYKKEALMITTTIIQPAQWASCFLSFLLALRNSKRVFATGTHWVYEKLFHGDLLTFIRRNERRERDTLAHPAPICIVPASGLMIICFSAFHTGSAEKREYLQHLWTAVLCQIINIG